MNLTRFEKARILGARSLQLALGAPSVLEGASPGIDALGLAASEFNACCIPLSVRRSSHALD